MTDRTKAQGQVVGKNASLKMRKEEMLSGDGEGQTWRAKKMKAQHTAGA